MDNTELETELSPIDISLGISGSLERANAQPYLR
jgi:hypothetical protein